MGKASESKIDNTKSPTKQDTNQSTKSKKEGSKKDEQDQDQELEVLKNLQTKDCPEPIISLLETIVKTFKADEEPSTICEMISKRLEKDYPKGWCVIAGKHFYGICVHEEKHFVQFEYEGNKVGLFKVYIPDAK